ncbi:MAG TPA: exodeoxyribonuclease V subunit beta [Candidatus Methylomirabilis sp.]|nr:exodeoxyribonuclease V subunit beta [Candidatus Methylomirabilis sp.]
MPRPAAPFDVFAVPLDGTVRIEASAGTGKTHTLADLYLRLVAEGGRSVDQILVVTYTVAATGELRDRIRGRLAEARAHLTGQPTGDPVLRRLRERSEERGAAARRLAEAVRSFDAAAVFTIHGFCQRVLTECAFESGQPFSSELLPDEHDLLQEVVDDFWRRTVPELSPLCIGYLVEKGVTPDALLKDIRPHLGKPYLVVAPPEEPPEGEALEAAYMAAYRGVRDRWAADREGAQALLTDQAVLNARSYPAAKVPGWLEGMDDFLAPAEPHLQTFDALGKLAASALAKATKKGRQPPAHPVFDVCETLAAAREAVEPVLEARRRRLVADCLAFAAGELTARKRQRQLHAYDDLLTELLRALDGPQGERLAGLIRERYSAALIDEFQDTDPVQYAIFRRVYGGHALPLVLVGDPKQAIYGFRGADIFTYLEARRGGRSEHPLDKNWRSDPPLIRAINTLWSGARHPFLFPEIGYRDVEAADKEREPLVIQGDSHEPLRFWVLPASADGKVLGKGVATEVAIRATVGEIVRLLTLGAEGRARIGSRPLTGGDLAVLVRTNRQGRQVRDALLEVRVPSVQQVQDSVFASDEAEELTRILLAVAEPGREALVRSALVTDLLGLTGDALEALAADERAWERRLEAFHADHERWQERGFVRMMRELLRRDAVPRRLLTFPDGERRLTNLLHLVELLQAEEDAEAAGMAGLIHWLADRRSAGSEAAEEAQLRLESDENLVKIATVHKSKGLEYRIVFCPFLWDGRLASAEAETLRYHDPTANHRPTLDLGSARQEEARAQARREELAESLRLTYVALTRAKHRCYAVWGHVRDGATAPLAYLLHQPPDLGDDPMDAVEAHMGTLGDEEIRADLDSLTQVSGGTIGVRPIPEEAPGIYRAPATTPESLHARVFTGSLAVPWRIASFSALAREAEAATEWMDDDLAAPAPPVTPPGAALDISRFPRGARPGQCLHALLERVDFTEARSAREPLVRETLAAHGFDLVWTPVVAGMLERVLDSPLDPGGVPLRLRDIGKGDRLDELEFHYPVARVTDTGLKRLLREHGYGAGTRIRDEVERLTFKPIEGYMRGFMDLVFRREGRFYLLDYKSNWLGEDPEAYRADRLSTVMAQEAYYLQSLIYLVALHRYLGHRIPGYAYEQHLGGIYYLFLRGMDPGRGPDAGVYRDRPGEVLIHSLDRYLATGEEA